MKTRLLGGLVGLAISFALPTFAQQKDRADPGIVQQRNLTGDPKALDEFGVLGMKFDQACNNNDAAAVAALFTENALLVTSDGWFSGRQDIEKRYADMFQRWPISTFTAQRCELNTIDNAAWSAGEWWSTLQSQNGPVFVRGYWSAIYVPEGDAWKIRMLTVSEKPRLAPIATPSPTTTPSSQ
jgi:ketosteroid isomerase-like protein